MSFFEGLQFTFGLSMGLVPAILIIMWTYEKLFYYEPPYDEDENKQP